VAGCTVLNDGSVRAWQRHSLHAGKNFARSGSCGPWIVTADEIGDLGRMSLTTRVNGELRQQTDVGQMIFPPDALIAYISQFTPLQAGDLIATGTPEGAGGSFSPPRFLEAGDRIEISVSGVGTLGNRVSTRPEPCHAGRLTHPATHPDPCPLHPPPVPGASSQAVRCPRSPMRVRWRLRACLG
jgi:2-keto-4-pentenoate hydratase/2-oxohepta-3-ene-1,7-dioic acid hydratase in catechol pathway